MNSVEFDKVVEGCIDKIKSVLQKKSQEYSSDDDKLHNFNKAKDLMRCKTKEFALLGMLNKHLVSVIDMIEKHEKTGELPNSHLLDEKIGDSINYFILLKACFLDDLEKTGKVILKDNIRSLLEEEKKQAEIERLNKEQAAIANSLYINPRKRLVVENLRKILKPLFVWLTDNNRFVDYEKIKGILNKAELEADSAPDEFVKDIVVFAETVLLPIEMKETRENIIAEIVRPPMTKFKVGDFIVPIYYANHLNSWVTDREVEIFRTGIVTQNKEIYYSDLFHVAYMEKDCFKTREEAQQECDKRNKSEQDIKDMFDTASDLTTAMVVNKRKKAVVDNMQDKLKPIIEYLQIVEPKQYQYFSNLCFQEIQKHNSITDKVFYKTTIDFLNSLMLPDKNELPQYKFRTMKQIRDSIVKRLEDELTRM